LNEQHNTFGPIPTSALEEIWSSSTSSAPTLMDGSLTTSMPDASTASDIDFPPFHRLVESLLQSQGEANDGPDVQDGMDGPKLSNSGGLRLEITAYLDKDRPLTEPKWVKSGHLEDWIKPAGLMAGGSGPGRIGGRGGAAAKMDDGDEAGSGWKDKLKVVDPDAVSRVVKRDSKNHKLTECTCSYNSPLPFRAFWRTGRWHPRPGRSRNVDDLSTATSRVLTTWFRFSSAQSVAQTLHRYLDRPCPPPMVLFAPPSHPKTFITLSSLILPWR
jgi:hypothetical protein